MKVVLDTNIVLVSISDKSPFHLIFKSFIENKFSIAVTTEILDEYAEILGNKISKKLSDFALEIIENAPNVHFIIKYFSFDLIKIDFDDNKFVDCAIASNSDYLVTNDSHFDVLKKLPFPKINVVNIDEFIAILKLKKTNEENEIKG